MRRFLYYLGLALLFTFDLPAQEVLSDFKAAITRPANLTDVAEQADGKIVVAGTITKINNRLASKISRLQADGSVDANFNPVLGDTLITCISLQTDQKILAGGYWDNGGEEVGILFRLQPDGSIDPSFQPDTFNNRVLSIEALSNQRIAVGGIFRDYGGQSTEGLVLLNNNGSIFKSYSFNQNNNILFTYDLLEVNNTFYASGNISSDAQLLRFDLDGVQDTNFTIDKIIGEDDFMTTIHQMYPRPNGDIAFTTYTWEFNPQVIVVNNNGTRVFQQGIPNPFGLTVTQQNQILVSGQLEGRPDVYLANANGLSPFVPGTMADDQVYDLLTLSTGNILAIGRFGEIKDQARESIVMFTPQRTLVGSFSPLIQRAGLLQEVLPVENQKLLVAGDFTRVDGARAINLTRLNADGSIDPSFQQTSISGNKPVNSIHQQADGKILVGTSASSLDPTQIPPISRLNNDGSKDNTFAIPEDISLLGNVNGIEQLEDNRIVIYGSLSLIVPGGFYRQIALLNPDGSFDPSLSAALQASSINDVVIRNNQLLIAGNNIRVNDGPLQSMISISPNGVQDNGFSTSYNSKTRINKLFPLDNGDILMSGRLYDGINYRELAKIKADGSPDPNFQWPVFSATSSPKNPPRDILELSNQQIILSNLSKEPSNQLFIIDPTGAFQDTLAVQSSAYYTQIIEIDDSTSYLSGAFTLNEEQISLAKVRLFSEKVMSPVDTTPSIAPSFYISSDSVQAGESVCLSIGAKDLEDILAIQLTFDYDPTKLAFASVGNFVGLPGLNSSDFGVPGNESNNAPGEIRLAWLDPDLSGFNASDSTALFDICFTALESTAGTNLTIVEDELVDAQDNLVDVTLTPGTVEITSIPIMVDPDTLLISMDDVSVKLGEDICIPVRVKDFNDIMGLQFNLNYDPSKLQYKALQNFNLPDLNLSSFGVPGTGANPAGRIKLAWLDLNVNGVTVSDETILFEVCFTALTGEGSSEITYSNEEVTRSIGENLIYKVETSTISFQPSDSSNPDPTILTINNNTVRKGESFCVPIVVEAFDSLIGLGFVLNFDPSKLAFESVGNFQLQDLSNNSFDLPGSGTVPDNQLITTWFDFSANGVTVSDQSAIFEVCFTALEDVGTTEISFSDIIVVGDDSNPRPFDSSPGTISFQEPISGDPPFTLTASSDSVGVGDNVCVQFTTDGFDDILGIELTITYDSSLLTYQSVGNFNLNGLSTSLGEPGQGNNPPGALKIAWFDNRVEGITLADGTTLFEMCFTAKAEGSSLIDFFEAEITGDVIDDVPFIGVAGDIRIGVEVVDTTGNETYDNDNFILSSNDDLITVEDTVCIPIQVKDFDGIKTLAFDFTFDSNVLEYSSIANPALPNLINQVTENSNSISIDWIDQTGNGASLSENSVLMDVCFVGKSEGLSTLSFNNASVTDNNNDNVNVQSQSADITVEAKMDTTGNETYDNDNFILSIIGDTIPANESFCVPIRVKDFNGIKKLVFDFFYDSNLLEYTTIINPALPNLINQIQVSANTSNSVGSISVDWLDQTGNGASLDEDAILMEICFRAKASGIGLLAFGNAEVTDNNDDLVAFQSESAFITIENDVIGTDFFTFRVASDTVEMGQTFCLDVSVDNFEDILGLKLSINYDPNILSFESIGGYNLKDLDERSFDLPGSGNAPPGVVELSWIDQDLQGVTLEDGSIIFQICFTAMEENTIGTVSMSNPNVLDSDGNVLNFVGIGGIIMVEEMRVVNSVPKIEQAKDRYRIYPVPTGPELIIEALRSIPNNAPFQIVNAQGQRLMLGQINGAKQVLNVNNLSPGYYNLIIHEDSGYWALPFIKL